MVLKSIIRYIIHRYLKNYIEALDHEKLNFDLRNGHASLENLRLKPEALADLNLPILVATGYLERLTLTIPWMNLQTNPTKVHLDGLYILIVPKNELGRDMSEHRVNKMKRVQRKVDELKRATLENKTLHEKDMTFFERMRLQIMQNVEVTIQNLHISYETQCTTKLGHPFSFGFTLYYLKLTGTSGSKSTTQTNTKAKGKTTIIYTLKDISLASIYWNTKCISRLDMAFNDVVADLKSKIATPSHRPKRNDMNYILNPSNLNVNIGISMTLGEHNFVRSAFDIDIQIEYISLNIDSKQFSDLLDFVKFQNYSTLYDRCREYRELYLQECLERDALTTEQKYYLQGLEAKLDVFNLAYIRYTVEKEIDETEMEHTSSDPATTAAKYYPWHWWRKKKHKSTDDARQTTTASTLDTYPDDAIRFYFEDLPSINILVRLYKADLYLISPLKNFCSRSIQSSNNIDREIIAHVNVADSRIDVIKRSVSSNTLLIVDLRAFRLYGIQNTQSQPPLLVTTISASSSPMMHIEFELFPVDKKKSDYRFHCTLEPLSIVYDSPMFNRIVEYFEPNNIVNYQTSHKINERSQIQMEHDLSCEKIFDMTIELKEISLLLPQNGIYKQNCSIINIRIVDLILRSCLDDADFHTQAKQGNERFYVEYKLTMNDLKVTFSPSSEKEISLIQRFHLFDIHFQKCIYSDDAHLIDWRIVAQINMQDTIQISTKILTNIILHLQSIPLLYPTLAEIVNRINLYFTIFMPYMNLNIDVLIHKCSILIDINSLFLIETNLCGHLSKGRKEIDKINFTLQDLIIKPYISTKEKKSRDSTSSFYQNQNLNLIYITNNRNQ